MQSYHFHCRIPKQYQTVLKYDDKHKPIILRNGTFVSSSTTFADIITVMDKENVVKEKRRVDDIKTYGDSN